jgi:hypothetical protein
MSGTQSVIAPGAGVAKMAWDPWPSCQNQVKAESRRQRDDVEQYRFGSKD